MTTISIDRSRARWSAVISLYLCAAASFAQVNVTTYHNDNARSGQNALETTLTPANVNSGQFGKLFSVAVDGYVYAQPLYLSGVAIGGGIHNVLYVATEHDSVYAIDADSGVIYRQASLIPSGGTTVSSSIDLGCSDLVPEVGVTGTPVIDVTSGSLLLVSKAKVGGVVVQHLHSLDIGTLAEKSGGPVLIAATVPGTAADGNGTTVSFRALQGNQRAALLLENGHLVIGWGSHCDTGPFHGWVMSYVPGSLTQEAVFNTSPAGNDNSIWMSGAGIAADVPGNLYLATGNGSWNGSSDFGDSIVKLAPPAGGRFAVLDYFTPYNQAALSAGDVDQGSGGIVLLPTLPSGRQLLAQTGKDGNLFLLDQAGLGKYCVTQTPACSSGNPQVVQEISKATAGIYGAPAFWNGNLYWSGVNDSIKAFSFNAGNSGLLSSAPTSKSANSFGFPALTPSVSANGSNSGILWGLDSSAYGSLCTNGSNCQVLYAYDASNLGVLLYTSAQAPNSRDVPGSAVKFTTPTIANGKVYVGSQYAVSAYGLLASGTTAVTVSLSGVVNVVAAGNSGAAVPAGGIDGGGTAYAAALLGNRIVWSGSTFALGNPGTPDAVSGVTVAVPAGNYAHIRLLATGVNGNQLNQPFVVGYTDGTTTRSTVSLSDWFTPQNYAGEAVALTTAYRLTSGGGMQGGPFQVYGYSLVTDSTRTAASITLPNNRNVVVLAIDAVPASAAPPAAAAPTFSLPPGAYTGAQAVTLADTTPGALIYYTTNGTTPTTSASLYVVGTPVALSATTTVNAFAVANGYTNSAVASSVYTISPQAATPVSVSLTGSRNVVGFVSTGMLIPLGGLDGAGAAYAAGLLGTTVIWSGATFVLGIPGTVDSVSGGTVALPPGSYSKINLLATAVFGNQLNQVFIVNYADGTHASFTRSLSDWFTPQNYPGEAQAGVMAYRVIPGGATQNGPFSVYGYSLVTDATKVIASISLPNNREVVILAVTLIR